MVQPYKHKITLEVEMTDRMSATECREVLVRLIEEADAYNVGVHPTGDAVLEVRDIK